MDRFWDKVSKGPRPKGCWEWTASTGTKGYGSFWYEFKTRGAHCVSWLLTGKDIPEGLYVLHHCDNRKCVNPEHLYVGTPQDNTDDMLERGRHVACPGEANGYSKLTADQVRYIRYSSATQQNLADVLNVSRPLISMIKSRRIWKNVI